MIFIKNFIWQCDPYFDDIGCSHPGCEPGFPTPKCERKCADKNKLWAESKHFSVNAYRIDSDPHSIMAEVSMNGPVEVAFTVYEVKTRFILFCWHLMHLIVLQCLNYSLLIKLKKFWVLDKQG